MQENGVKYVQSKQPTHKNNSIDVFLVSFLSTYFAPFSNYEQVNVCWVNKDASIFCIRLFIVLFFKNV